jgi:hypothetical protein
MDIQSDIQSPIEKFKLGKPDGDGDMSYEFVTPFKNATKDEVHLVQSDLSLLDGNGFVVGWEADVEETVRIAPGKVHKMQWNGLIKSDLVAKEVNAVVHATLYAREVHELGEIEIPEKPLTKAGIDRAITSSLLEGPVKAVIWRLPDSDDGQCELRVTVLVANRLASPVARAESRFQVISAKGSEVGDEDGERRSIRGHSHAAIAGYCWVTASKKLKGAKVRVRLEVFREVQVLSFTGKASVAKG